jgi:hypothetical protein
VAVLVVHDRADWHQKQNLKDHCGGTTQTSA